MSDYTDDFTVFLPRFRRRTFRGVDHFPFTMPNGSLSVYSTADIVENFSASITDSSHLMRGDFVPLADATPDVTFAPGSWTRVERRATSDLSAWHNAVNRYLDLATSTHRHFPEAKS
jgi:hypothetical protein